MPRFRAARLLAVMLAAMLAQPLRAAAQSGFAEAAAWCARRDPATPVDRAIAGCSWLIRSGLLDPRNTSIVLANRGYYLSQLLHRHQAGMADYNDAVRADPTNAIALNGRGALRSDLGDRIGAMADYDAAIRFDPRSRDAWNNRGNQRRAQGDLRGAIADYDQALRINPRNAHALANRCIARHRQNEAALAEADCAAAIEAAAPDNPWPHTARGGLALLAGDAAQAAEDAQAAVRRSPDNPHALRLRALVRAHLGDATGGAADATAAQARLPRIDAIMAEIFGPGIAPP
jgi:tetratricopeptide (TPR) repeat protein